VKNCINLLFMCCILFKVQANPITKKLQAILDSGGDLVLEQGKTYDIDATLKFTKSGQQIYTKGASSIRDYAIIKIINPRLVTIITAEGIKDIVIKNVRLDGNRDNMRPKGGVTPSNPFIALGQLGGDNQTIKNCVITNARCSGGWAAIHVHPYAFNTTIQDNIIFGAGVDILGNGRSDLEYPFGFGDGVSVAARNSLVKNNLIIDATDEAVMVQGAPGTKVENNVVVALSREVFAGIALIDPAKYSLLDAAKKTYDFRGVKVKNNLVNALGSRVHIGYACGKNVFSFNQTEQIIVGGELIDNIMIGDIGGYGFAVGGVKDFKIKNNKASGVFEERGDGFYNDPPDEATAFIYDKSRVFDSKLQKEFIPAIKHINHINRNLRKPSNESGYRILDHYGKIESKAIVSIAFMEMLNRFPSEKEMLIWNKWLKESRSTGDAIRRNLMMSSEFINKNNKSWRITQLQECRVALFMEELYTVFEQQKSDSWPSAHELHERIFSKYSN
jgi:hypothetical protein